MEQREKMRSQSPREYWKNPQVCNTTENYLAYCNKMHRALIHTDFESIPTSSSTAERNYPLVRVPTEEELGLKPSVQEYVGDIIATPNTHPTRPPPIYFIPDIARVEKTHKNQQCR